MVGVTQEVMSWLAERLDKRNPRVHRDMTLVMGRPTLQELSQTAPVVGEATACLRHVFPGVDERLVQQASREFADTNGRLAQKKSMAALRYPANFPVQGETARFIYLLIRACRPQVVLETGVADGYSTAVMLAALEENGIGELHSVDISDDVGALVEDRARWRLHVVRRDRGFRQVRRVAGILRPIDIFFHDADHRFVQQTQEYELARTIVRPGGFLVSDDVDFSYAFREFVAAHHYPSAILLDAVKCSGVLRFG